MRTVTATFGPTLTAMVNVGVSVDVCENAVVPEPTTDPSGPRIVTTTRSNSYPAARHAWLAAMAASENTGTTEILPGPADPARVGASMQVIALPASARTMAADRRWRMYEEGNRRIVLLADSGGG